MSLLANLNRIIIAVLVLIILVMVAGWYWISSQARRESFEMARQLDPDNAEMMYAYGYSQQGNLDQALYWMGKAALVDPQNLDLGGWMVFLNDSLEDYGAAQEWSDWLDDWITKQPAPMAMQARHHYMTGNFELALQFSNRALKMDIPDRWGSDSVFMRIKRDEALANGNPGAGIEVFRERHPALFKAVPEITPANAVQAVDLAQLLKMASKPDQAAKLLNAVIEFYDQPWAATGATLFPLAPVKAEALAIMGNEAAATTELRRIIDKGWRLDWRWETELNFNFNGIRETTEFKTMVNELAANMAEQRARVHAMIDRGEIAPPPEPRTR
jgi:tetratricopeptide (TPR) repeat protein